MSRITSSVSCKKTFWPVGNFLKYTLIAAFLLSALFCEIIKASEPESKEVQDGGESLEQLTNLFSSTNKTTDLISNSSSTNETSWEDGNWRRKDKSKIAAIAVYCSVILIAIFGILVKYFVTQYEVLQAKAQLEYQQLRNVRA